MAASGDNSNVRSVVFVCACPVRVRVVGFCHCALVRCPCRWAHCVWRVLLQHPGRSAVSVPGSGSYVFVRHRSHFGSRYKLGCCGHAGLFYVRWCHGERDAVRLLCAAWRRGHQLVERRLHVRMSCDFVGRGTRSYDVFCLGSRARLFRRSRWFSQPTVRDCWQPLASRLPQEKYCYG